MAPENRLARAEDRSKGSVAALALLSLVCLTGSSVRETSVDEMVAHSEFIFEGRVTGLEAREAAEGRQIHTYVSFQILDIIKGPPLGTSLELRFLGGSVGEKTLSVSDMRLPSLGERGIYFVESLSRRQVHPLFGWSQGHLLVLADGEGRQRVCSLNRVPIVAMEPTPQGPARRLSAGLARGLVAGEPGRIETAVELDRFKAHLRKLQGKTTP